MDTAVDSEVMLLALGGLKGELDIPPFEFFSLTDNMPVKRIFVRDLYQAWYHRGLSEGTPSIESTAAHLHALVAQEEVNHLVVVGTSAGGYAALLFGALLGAQRVLSFCPQTTIDPRQLEEMQDRRWDERPRVLFERGHLEPRWLDLRASLPESHTRFDVFFDETHRPDLVHAERIAGVRGVNLQRHRESGHLIARKMRDSGELVAVLHSALVSR